MSNMSAQILRSLVSSVFNVKAIEVHLSGEISPNWTAYAGSTRGGMWDSEEDNAIWGFNPKTGFKLLNIIGDLVQDEPDSPVYQKNAIPLCEVEGVQDFIFFVVHNKFTYCDNQRMENYDNWSLYKAPNFSSYITSVEEADIQRWESWIS